MAQADDRTPMTGEPGGTLPAAPSPRISFQSAGAVRRPHPTPLAVPAVQAAHITLISALASLKPHRIIGSYAADRFDILEPAEHLEKGLAAVTGFTQGIVADTAYLGPRGHVAHQTRVLEEV